jgi:hypothetical protein
MKIVENAYAVQSLHAKVLQSFYNETIGIEQAIAFSSIPNPNAQWALLQQLGPFVSDENVVRALQEGEAVIETPDDQMIFLPTREKAKIAQAYTQPHYADDARHAHEFKIAA